MTTELAHYPRPSAPQGCASAEPALRAKPRRVSFHLYAFMKKIKDRLEEYLNGRREVIHLEGQHRLGHSGVANRADQLYRAALKLKDGSRHRETLGAYGKLTVEAAREAAQAIAGKIAMGVDLQAERAQAEAKAKAKAEAEEAKKFTVAVLIDQCRQKASQRPTPPICAPSRFRNVEPDVQSLLKTPGPLGKAHRCEQRRWRCSWSRRRSSAPAAVTEPWAARQPRANAAASLKAAYKWAAGGDVELLSENPPGRPFSAGERGRARRGR